MGCLLSRFKRTFYFYSSRLRFLSEIIIILSKIKIKIKSILVGSQKIRKIKIDNSNPYCAKNFVHNR